MFNKVKRLRLVLLALCMLPLIGCFSISYFIDMDADGSGRGIVYHTLTFPVMDETENSNASVFDSYSQNLVDEGWENIEITSPGNDQIQLSATYSFDLVGGKTFPESMKNMSIQVEDGENGERKFIFNGTYDYTQLKTSWEEFKNGESYDLGPWLGGEQVIVTKEEVDEYIRRYGEPVAEFRVRLAGNNPLEATGSWSNSSEFLNGQTDTLIFSWNPSMATTGSLHAVNQWLPEQEKTEEPSATSEATQESYVDEELIGKPCDEFCLSLDPIGFWLDGETYPNCRCDCGVGNTFTQLSCVTNQDLCSGEGMQLVTNKDKTGYCMCTDPNKKYDFATRSCIDLVGNECNRANGCEPQYGENCQNCSDCGCSFGSGANAQYSQYLTCNPGNAKADIYGCVFEMPDKAEQLEIMQEEWNECRDAWALMNLASGHGTTGYQTEVMNAISELSKVQTWQQKSGCITTAGVVVGREAVDPMICLMRYCDRIKTGIHQLEQQVQQNAPVMHGPSIKTDSPNIKVTTGPLQVPYFSGAGAVYGNSPLSLQVSMGEGFVHSEYEIVSDAEGNVQIYLYEGAYTYTYFDPATSSMKQVELASGEMLSVDAAGLPIEQTSFDAASREAWWENRDYVVDCPANSTQQGADCYCDTGYEVNAELETCEAASTEILDADIDLSDQASTARSERIRKMLRLGLCGFTSLILVVAFVLILVFKKK